jgi:hypothetical protein
MAAQMNSPMQTISKTSKAEGWFCFDRRCRHGVGGTLVLFLAQKAAAREHFPQGKPRVKGKPRAIDQRRRRGDRQSSAASADLQMVRRPRLAKNLREIHFTK